jgi:hypothetical protein
MKKLLYGDYEINWRGLLLSIYHILLLDNAVYADIIYRSLFGSFSC